MGYDENYTCKYVYASSGANNNGGDTLSEFVIQLPFCKERTPNMKIQLISAKARSFNAGTLPAFALRMKETPDDFYSLDNQGAVLTLMGVDHEEVGGVAPRTQYQSAPAENNPEYVISSGTKQITLFAVTELLGEFNNKEFIFKLSYPRQPDEIQQQYSAQIHRMGN
jgi:hypothetical protein